MSKTINGIEMITDRSSSDVALAKSLIKKGFQNMTDNEKETFLSGMKGAYNYTDVNRVESVVSYLAERLVTTYEELRFISDELGVCWEEDIYGVPYDQENYKNWETKNDWSINDIFSEKERSKYLEKIINVLQSLDSVPDNFPKTLVGLTYSGANIIESSIVVFFDALVNLKKEKETLIAGTAESWFYSGDVYGGET